MDYMDAPAGSGGIFHANKGTVKPNGMAEQGRSKKFTIKNCLIKGIFIHLSALLLK